MYIEPMYRGTSRGPCVGTIYPTLLEFGGIQAIILSYSASLTERDKERERVHVLLLFLAPRLRFLNFLVAVIFRGGDVKFELWTSKFKCHAWQNRMEGKKVHRSGIILSSVFSLSLRKLRILILFYLMF